jgi:hypothetical protein
MKKTQSTIIDDDLTEHKIYKEKPWSDIEWQIQGLYSGS